MCDSAVEAGADALRATRVDVAVFPDGQPKLAVDIMFGGDQNGSGLYAHARKFQIQRSGTVRPPRAQRLGCLFDQAPAHACVTLGQDLQPLRCLEGI